MDTVFYFAYYLPSNCATLKVLVLYQWLSFIAVNIGSESLV